MDSTLNMQILGLWGESKLTFLRYILLFSMAVGFTSCTTISYEVSTDIVFSEKFLIQDPRVQGNSVEIRQTINQDVPPILPIFCGITAIYFGGGCWAYFLVESSYVDDAIKQAKKNISLQLGEESPDTYSYQSIRLLDQNWERKISTYKVGRTLRPGRYTSLSKEKRSEKPHIPPLVSRRKLSEKTNESHAPDQKEGLIASLDLGTSHSSHGIGMGLGYSWSDYSFLVGYGIQSKLGVLGNPVSASFLMNLNSIDSSYVRFGATYYGGQGNRKVIFGDNVPIKLDVKWSFIYSRVGLGSVSKLYNLNVYWEGGLSTVARSRIVPNHTGTQTNLDDPVGIQVDDSDQFGIRSNAGHGDFGAYIQTGVYL